MPKSMESLALILLKTTAKGSKNGHLVVVVEGGLVSGKTAAWKVFLAMVSKRTLSVFSFIYLFSVSFF